MNCELFNDEGNVVMYTYKYIQHNIQLRVDLSNVFAVGNITLKHCTFVVIVRSVDVNCAFLVNVMMSMYVIFF